MTDSSLLHFRGRHVKRRRRSLEHETCYSPERAFRRRVEINLPSLIFHVGLIFHKTLTSSSRLPFPPFYVQSCHPWNTRGYCSLAEVRRCRRPESSWRSPSLGFVSVFVSGPLKRGPGCIRAHIHPASPCGAIRSTWASTPSSRRSCRGRFTGAHKFEGCRPRREADCIRVWQKPFTLRAAVVA